MSPVRATESFSHSGLTDPTIRAGDHWLSVRTSGFMRALTLFAADRHLRIDTNRRVLRLRARRWWLWSQTRIVPFSRIKSIVYGYSGLPTGFDFTAGGATVPDRLDTFSVGLLLTDDPQPMHLFDVKELDERLLNTALAGAIDTISGGAVGVDEGLIEVNEERASRKLVWRLRKYLQVPVRSLLHAKVADALRASLHPCPTCERKIMRNAVRCVYCGTRFGTGA